jgi:hypothetical protein
MFADDHSVDKENFTWPFRRVLGKTKAVGRRMLIWLSVSRELSGVKRMTGRCFVERFCQLRWTFSAASIVGATLS